MAQTDNPVAEAQQEIEQSQKAMAEAFKSLNQVKPLTANNGAAAPVGTPDLSGLQNLLAQPGLQKYVKLVNSPDFGSDLAAVVNHPGRMRCLQAELGWFFFIMVLRAWRNSKSKHWTKNIWIYLWTTLLFWVGALYFIPHHFLGEAYDKLSYEIAATIKG